MRTTLALAAPLLLAGCVATRAVMPDRPPRERVLRVAGEGKAAAAPDVAVASFGVETWSRTLAEATREADEKMRRIVAALAQAGVQGRDVQTTRHDVSIERQVDPKGALGPISGFRVGAEVRATMRDLPRAGAILDAVVQAGANTVHSLAFQKDDPAPELSRARAAAVADARAKAQEMAAAAGVALVEVLELSEGGRSAPPVPMVRMARMAAEGAPVEPGQLEFTVSVDVVYGIR